MAFNFSANQYEYQYTAKRMNNWELPKMYPARPIARKCPTKPIVNRLGHFCSDAYRVDCNPWGYFRNTHQFPRRITRKFVQEYHQCLNKRFLKRITENPCVCPDKNFIRDFKCPNKFAVSKKILREAEDLELKRKRKICYPSKFNEKSGRSKNCNKKNI